MSTIEIPEGSPFTYTTVLTDAAGAPIPSVQLSTLTLTLYNVADGSIINSRDAQNVKDANNGTFHATSGLFTWQAQSADSPIVSSTVLVGQYEHHRAVFFWSTLAGGPTNISKHEVDIFVRNLEKVP